jgi:hypothetical protein
MEHADGTSIAPPPPAPGDDSQRSPLWRRAGLVAVGLAALGLAVGGIVQADMTDRPYGPSPGIVETEPVTGGATCGPPLGEEEIADINADQEALAVFLDMRGISYRWVAYPDGLFSVVPETGSESEDALDEFYATRDSVRRAPRQGCP